MAWRWARARRTTAFQTLLIAMVALCVGPPLATSTTTASTTTTTTHSVTETNVSTSLAPANVVLDSDGDGLYGNDYDDSDGTYGRNTNTTTNTTNTSTTATITSTTTHTNTTTWTSTTTTTVTETITTSTTAYDDSDGTDRGKTNTTTNTTTTSTTATTTNTTPHTNTATWTSTTNTTTTTITTSTTASNNITATTSTTNTMTTTSSTTTTNTTTTTTHTVTETNMSTSLAPANMSLDSDGDGLYSSDYDDSDGTDSGKTNTTTSTTITSTTVTTTSTTTYTNTTTWTSTTNTTSTTTKNTTTYTNTTTSTSTTNTTSTTATISTSTTASNTTTATTSTTSTTTTTSSPTTTSTNTTTSTTTTSSSTTSTTNTSTTTTNTSTTTRTTSSTTTITTTMCGNGLLEIPGETCDDGNTEPYDGCSATCQSETGRCIHQAHLICAAGFVVDTAVSEYAFCGKNFCTLAECCAPNSTLVEGLAVCPAGEVCEPLCGDGLVKGQEACDDGGNVAGDGCDSSCAIEPGWYCVEGAPCETECGDGVLGAPVEACDDGNTDAFDGCSATCQLEPGRCAVQAATLCVGTRIQRTDVPTDMFCFGQWCTHEECCFEAPPGGSCESDSCMVAFGRGMAPVPLSRPCDAVRCPAGGVARPDAPSVVCEDFFCRLTACCTIPGETCTCAPLQCCSGALLSAKSLDAGTIGDVDLQFTRVATTSGAGARRATTYYLLGGGRRSLASLGAMALKLEHAKPFAVSGFSFVLPSVDNLEELFALPSVDKPELPDPVGGWHIWTSTTHPGGRTVVNGRLGYPRGSREYIAPLTRTLDVVLEVSENFSVLHGSSRLRRVTMQERGSCCFTGEYGWLAGVPVELEGATFFALEGESGHHRGTGTFTVLSAVPVLVYAFAVVDPYNQHDGRFASGFEDLGWTDLRVPGFRLTPWEYQMGCWVANISAGVQLEVPHGNALFGSVAVQYAE